MGPSIILDKSAVESIGDKALHVQSANFYTVVTPVLVWEICGDIEKARAGECKDTKVKVLARRAKPFDSVVTTDWRKICLAELMGLRTNMTWETERRALVDGSHQVPIAGGGFANVLDHQPEAEVLLRWSSGHWTEQDAKYAEWWRRSTKTKSLEEYRRRYGTTRRPIETVEQFRDMVDKVLADPALQFYLMSLVVDEMGLPQTDKERLLRRWRNARVWPPHAKFTRYCARAFIAFGS